MPGNNTYVTCHARNIDKVNNEKIISLLNKIPYSDVQKQIEITIDAGKILNECGISFALNVGFSDTDLRNLSLGDPRAVIYVGTDNAIRFDPRKFNVFTMSDVHTGQIYDNGFRDHVTNKKYIYINVINDTDSTCGIGSNGIRARGDNSIMHEQIIVRLNGFADFVYTLCYYAIQCNQKSQNNIIKNKLNKVSRSLMSCSVDHVVMENIILNDYLNSHVTAM